MEINSLDLFSGAGGLSLGMSQAGVACSFAIEADRFSTQTFSQNFSKSTVFNQLTSEFNDLEIRQRFRGLDALIAGPPCQGFSVAGPSQYGIDDPRNNLVFEVVRYTNQMKPLLVLVENVPGILRKARGPMKVLDAYTSKMDEAGYNTVAFSLNAKNFGLPQMRERAFIVSVRKPAKFDPDRILNQIGEKVSVWEAIGDLPQIGSGEGVEELVPYTSPVNSNYQKSLRRDSEGVSNHVAMKHTKRLIDRFKTIPQGGSLVDAPPEHGQRVRNGSEIDVRKRFKMNNQRLHPDQISWAITASFQSNFIHPHLDRNLTAREGARLQSFPDSFLFTGPRTLMSKKLLIRENRMDEIGLSQYNQIGNAVPPILARKIGEEIFAQLHKGSIRKAS